MTILEYKTHFHALPRYVITSISVEFKRIKKFVKGLSVITLVGDGLVGSFYWFLLEHNGLC